MQFSFCVRRRMFLISLICMKHSKAKNTSLWKSWKCRKPIKWNRAHLPKTFAWSTRCAWWTTVRLLLPSFIVAEAASPTSSATTKMFLKVKIMLFSSNVPSSHRAFSKILFRQQTIAPALKTNCWIALGMWCVVSTQVCSFRQYFGMRHLLLCAACASRMSTTRNIMLMNIVKSWNKACWFTWRKSTNCSNV